MNHAMETSGEGNKNSNPEALPTHQSFPLKEQNQTNSATRKSLGVIKDVSEGKKPVVENKRRSDQDIAFNPLFLHRNQSKSKKNKFSTKKMQKSRILFEEEEKQSHWGNENKGFQSEKEELIQPEKPTLIKTFSFDQDEYEITLETFLNNEYGNNQKNDVVKTTEMQMKSSAYKLINPEPERVIHLTNQMKFRLQEGKGEAKYEIGVAEDGIKTGLAKAEMHQSLRTLCSLASSLQADVIILSLRNATHGKIADVLIRSHQKDGIKLDIKIMLLGDKQCGKSTLIGVLTSGKSDNGKGSARMNVHSHKHEVISGETSTLSHHILGFDSQGVITNNLNSENSTWEQIVDKSTKILTFIDIGGHEKFTAKIVSGLCSFYPDYTGIVISAVEGLTQITEQHLKIASLFGVPFFIVITHIDLVDSDTFYELRDNLERSLRKYSEDSQLVVAQNEEDNIILTRTLKEKIVVPVFVISNVTGKNMDLFKSFLNLLPVNNPLSPNINLHSEFYIHTIFNRENKTILGGTVIKGSIKKHQVLALGPDDKGKFWHIEVSSIQYKKVPVKLATCGQSCTIEIKLGKFALQWINSNKDALRRGMVLVDIKSNPKATIEFIAEINLFEEKQTKAIIWEGYEPVITSQTTHQVCAIDFDQIKAEEIKEEDLQKLKQLTDSLSTSRGAKKKRSIDEFNLPLLSLTRQKSKSQDFKEIQSQYKQKNEGMEKSPGRKLSSFSRRKLANVFLKANISVSEENIQNNLSDGSKAKKSSKGKMETSSHFKQLFDEVGHSSMGLQQKLKKLQKDIYLYAEDFAPKKKTQIKFITIEPNQPKILRFRFKYHPEYLTKGQKIIINDSTMKAIGTIRDLFYVVAETQK